LLKSYHLYLPSQKVSKNPQKYRIHNTLPKNAKSHFGYFCPLGVKPSKDSINLEIEIALKVAKKLIENANNNVKMITCLFQ
jgi:hypothetical protein